MRISKLLPPIIILLFLASCASGTKNVEKNKYPIIYPDGAQKITSDYGSLTNTKGYKRKKQHRAIDIEGKIGDSILAAADGVVVKSDDIGKYGLRIIIDHGKGCNGDRFYTLYLHNNRNLVNVGDKVKRGEKIAVMGLCPVCLTTHLHFAVIKGRLHGKVAVNPLQAVNPHEYWFDGCGRITCYDPNRKYPQGKTIRFIYPVMCR